MAGLQSLIQGGNKPAMPGQAGAFTALPAQQGRNPVAYTKALKQIPPEDLIRIYNDPNDLRPKWAVASAYADAMKAKALQQGAMGQQAQAQNAAAQQTPPVADQVMAVMAASGGEMRAYADGGAIGFSKGDSTDVFTVLQRLSEEVQRAEQASVAADQALRKYDSVLRHKDPQGFESAKQAAAQAQKALDDARKAYRAGPTMTAGVLQASPAQEPVAAAVPKPLERPPTGIQALASGVAESAASPATSVTSRTSMPNQPAATSPAAEAPAGLSPYSQRLEKAEEERNRIVREGANISPGVMAARQRMEQLSAGRLQRSQQDAEKIRSEGIRQLQGRLDAARRPLIDDPEALLSLAASINPQRGKTMGSLAGGLSSILAGRRARAEKAEEGISVLNEKVRLLNSQYQEAEALEEQRKYAILNRDADLKRETEQKIADNNVRMRQTQAEIDIRLQDVKARESAARASRESAAQGREMIGLQRLTVALDNRNKTYQKARADWLNSTPVKLAQMAASTPNAPKEKINDWEKMQQDFETSFKNSQEIRNLDAAISRMSQEAGVPMPSSVNTTGWSIEKVQTPGQE